MLVITVMGSAFMGAPVVRVVMVYMYGYPHGKGCGITCSVYY